MKRFDRSNLAVALSDQEVTGVLHLRSVGMDLIGTVCAPGEYELMLRRFQQRLERVATIAGVRILLEGKGRIAVEVGSLTEAVSIAKTAMSAIGGVPPVRGIRIGLAAGYDEKSIGDTQFFVPDDPAAATQTSAESLADVSMESQIAVGASVQIGRMSFPSMIRNDGVGFIDLVAAEDVDPGRLELFVGYAGLLFAASELPGGISIGRHPDCHVRLTDPRISKRHATVSIQDGTPVITDHSTNGTLVMDASNLRRCLRHEVAVVSRRAEVVLGYEHGRAVHSPIHVVAERLRFREE